MRVYVNGAPMRTLLRATVRRGRHVLHDNPRRESRFRERVVLPRQPERGLRARGAAVRARGVGGRKLSLTGQSNVHYILTSQSYVHFPLLYASTQLFCCCFCLLAYHRSNHVQRPWFGGDRHRARQRGARAPEGPRHGGGQYTSRIQLMNT
jgi:hypothetical protein